MNEVKILQDTLQRRFPSCWFRLTAPLNANGQWTLDIWHDARWLVVNWMPPDRFGVSEVSDSSVYGGEGADEIFTDANSTLSRIEVLLTTRLVDRD